MPSLVVFNAVAVEAFPDKLVTVNVSVPLNVNPLLKLVAPEPVWYGIWLAEPFAMCVAVVADVADVAVEAFPDKLVTVNVLVPSNVNPLLKVVSPEPVWNGIWLAAPPDMSVANVAFPLKSPIKIVSPIKIDAVNVPVLGLYFNLLLSTVPPWLPLLLLTKTGKNSASVDVSLVTANVDALPELLELPPVGCAHDKLPFASVFKK